MYRIIVEDSNGVVWLRTQKPLAAEELPGILNIINSPSMFGSVEFEVTIKRI